MKQVQMNDSVNEALNEITKARKLKTPHRSVTKQETVADLILKAHKREVKK